MDAASIYNEQTLLRRIAGDDMIRFGKFEDAYGFKTDADLNHRIFPIPTTALSTNATLTQNLGY